MIPVIAIVGRPNVGKSTLFNVLTKSRQALVADLPGVTRDRIYGEGVVGGRDYFLIDTGGLSGESSGIDGMMLSQSEQAIDEATAIIFLVDARDGLNASDEAVAQYLRQKSKKVFLVVNKVDGIDERVATVDFYPLGLGEPYPISAAHQQGISHLMEAVLETFPVEEKSEEALAEELAAKQGIKIAIVGRPNVGKSTLVNRLLGEERVVVFDLPGTTRDSIYIPMERRGKKYTLIDTAGLRRRARIDEAIEKFSVIKTLQAIKAADVVIFVIDAKAGLAEQDLTILGQIIEEGRAVVIAINKWDGLTISEKDFLRKEMERRLSFVNFARFHFISALHGTGVGDLYKLVEEAYQSAMVDLSTPRLTRLLQDALITHQPPLVKGRRIKLRYAHAGGHNPPIIVIHGNQSSSVPESYRRYLMNYFRDALRLVGTPLRVDFKQNENPYAKKRNLLTPRQERTQKRLSLRSGKK